MSTFLWRFCLSGLSSIKCGFCMQNSLSNTLEACIEIFFCVLDLIQIIISIMTLGYRPNIHWNWTKHFSKNSFNPIWRMMAWEPLLKCVAIRTSFRLKITWNGFTSITSERSTTKSKPKVDGISFKSTSTTKHEFNDSMSFTWGIWESKPEVGGISFKSISTTKHEFNNSTSFAWGIWESKPEVGGISFNSTSTTKHEFNDSTSFAWGIWESKLEVGGISSAACEFDDPLSSTLGNDTSII